MTYLWKGLRLLNERFSRNLRQREWWDDVVDHLPCDTVLFQFDFKKTMYFTDYLGQNHDVDLQGTSPFCLTFISRDPNTREIVRHNRIMLPSNVKHPSSYITIEVIKAALTDQTDGEVQRLLQRMRHCFVTTLLVYNECFNFLSG